MPAASAQGLAADEYGSATLKGAGSTFVYPLADRWAREYRNQRLVIQADNPRVARWAPNMGLDDADAQLALEYEPVGSLAGIQRIGFGAVDLAFTEMPLSTAELRRHRLLQWPVVLGGVAVVVNLPGLAQPLRLNGPVLADIFLGRITAWNDPALAALNPGTVLPEQAIQVVHRSDGSGATFTFTQYLAAAHADWKPQIGFDSLVKWPVGRGYKGSGGMVRAVAAIPGGIGYVDAVQAQRAKLPVAHVQNAAGSFVAPTREGVTAAASAAAWEPARDFEVELVNEPGAASYPITAVVFALTKDLPRNRRAQRTLAFVDWALNDGRALTEQLGYVALPAGVQAAVGTALATRQAAR